MIGCTSTEPAIAVHNKQRESYSAAAKELTNYGLNLLATMVQERLIGVQAAHATRQQQLIAAGDAAGAVQDELQYQAILVELQNQVMAEFTKISRMHQGLRSADAFHEVVQTGLRNANRINVNEVIALANAVVEETGLDLGPLNDVLKSIHKARNLPEVETAPISEESNT